MSHVPILPDFHVAKLWNQKLGNSSSIQFSFVHFIWPLLLGIRSDFSGKMPGVQKAATVYCGVQKEATVLYGVLSSC